MAELFIDGFDRLSPHALRVGFITEAGVRDEDIMRHIRHRDLRTMRGYVHAGEATSKGPLAAWNIDAKRRCLCGSSQTVLK
jgi:hypothetical protein